ncbi:MAG: Ig-like domain-containing protein [Alphaproteobacteria bacterium]
MTTTNVEGTPTFISENIINPYTGEILPLLGTYYINDTHVDGGAGTSDVLSGSPLNQYYRLVDAAGDLLIENIEFIFPGSGNDIVNIASTTHVLGDMIIATAGGDDIVWSNSGNDIIDGSLGNDILHGGPGHDTITGGDDNDIITGGQGDDNINGGSGVDVAIYTGAFANYTIADNAGTLTVTDNVGTDGVDTVNAVETLVFVDGLYQGGVFVPNVPATNDKPVLGKDSTTVDEDGSVIINVLANDSDPDGDALSVTSVGGVNHGVAVINTDGTITYTPNADFFGEESFYYTVTDARGETATQRVNVTIDPVADDPEPNVGPVLRKDNVTVDENDSVVIDVLANDSDQNGDTLEIVQAWGANNGSIVVNADNTITYTPNAGYNGSESFYYQASDGNGGLSTQIVNVSIAAVITAPDADLVSLDLGAASLSSYSNQDNTPTGAGASEAQLSLAGNSWKVVDLPSGYTTTEYSVLRFDFSSNTQGEIHGIGLDTDNDHTTGDRLVQVYGTQNWGQDGPDYAGDGSVQGFDILLSDYYNVGETYTQLVFVNDDDANSNADSLFENVSFYELGDDASQTMVSGDGSQQIFGLGGDDILYAGDDNDILYGGEGADVLHGEGGADMFVFEFDSFFAVDEIADFNTSEDDSINISYLLEGYDPVTDAIADFVQITDNGVDSVLSVDVDGGADNFVQIATITGATGLSDEDALEAAGNLITVI